MSIFSFFSRSAQRDRRISDLRNEIFDLTFNLKSKEDEVDRLNRVIDRLEKEVDEEKQKAESARRKLFPYADATEISGVSWDGKYLIGDKESVKYFHEMKNRGEQIDVYKAAYDQKEARLKADLQAAEKKLDLQKLQMLNFVDAVALFRDRYGISAIELSQLGLGTFIPGDKDKSPMCVLGSLEDAKDAIEFTMKNQATAAKFRQLKAHFQQHQQAVTVLLDELNRLGARNHVTKEDLRKIRELRDTLSGLIGRSI